MKFQKHTLENGFSIVLVSNHALPIIDAQGWVRAGSAMHDNPCVPGLAAQLLTHGTQRHSREEFEDALDEFALQLSVGTSSISPFFVEWDGRALASQCNKLFELAFEALSEPTFPKEELSIFQQRNEAAARNSASDPGEQAYIASSRMLYEPTHLLYELNTDEAIGQLRAVSQDDLRAFHIAHYGPRNSGLVVVGDFDPDEMYREIAGIFASWSSAGWREPDYDQNRGAARKNIYEEQIVFIPEKANAVVRIGQCIPVTRTHRDYPTLQVGARVLGMGPSCRLHQRVREERGLSYKVQALLKATIAIMPTYFSAVAHTNPRNVHETQQEMQSVIAKWHRDGITQQELEQECARYRGAKAYNRSIFELVGQELVTGEIMGESDFMGAYEERLAALTVDEVNAAICRYFNPETMKVVRAGTVT